MVGSRAAGTRGCSRCACLAVVMPRHSIAQRSVHGTAQVMKLVPKDADSDLRGIAAPMTMANSQPLEGHRGE